MKKAINKTALVTGGSRGLGREIALALGRAGYAVAVNFKDNETKAEETAGLIGGGSFAVGADVGDADAVESMARQIKARRGRLDVLINNAGIARDALIIKQGEPEWDDVIRTNLKGCFNTVKALAPLMIASGGGHIVNISSYSGLRGKKGQSAYSASKSAVIGLTLSLSAELGRHNIRVNAVLPGFMPTGMGVSASDAMEEAKAKSYIRKLSDPAEAAGFIAWLVGTEGITGSVFMLDSRG